MITTKEIISLSDLQSLPHTEEVAIATEEPRRGIPPYRGIPHHDLISTLLVEASGREIRIDEPIIHLSPDRLEMACSLSLFHPKISPELPTDCNLSVGLTTGNTGKVRLHTFYGVQTIWGAGIAFGNLSLPRKHVLGFDLGEFAVEMFDTLDREGKKIPKLIERLKGTRVEIEQVIPPLVEAGEQGLIPPSRVAKVLKEIVSPQSGQTGRTSWNVLHAFAVVNMLAPVLPNRNTPGQMASILGFYAMLPVKGGRLS